MTALDTALGILAHDHATGKISAQEYATARNRLWQAHRTATRPMRRLAIGLAISPVVIVLLILLLGLIAG